MFTSPQRLYKFGRTSSGDIMERFSLEIHYQRNWRNVPLALDYAIKPIWSMWVTKEEAIRAEEWFETKYPKTYYSDVKYNGITECRDWKPNQSYAFFDILDKKYKKDFKYWLEIEQKQLGNTLKDTHEKIYYIMLTKK